MYGSVLYDLNCPEVTDTKPSDKQQGVLNWYDMKLIQNHNHTAINTVYPILYIYVYIYVHGLLLMSLRWRHNDHAGVSNHQPHGCLLNRFFRRKSKKTSKLRVTGLCAGNSPGTGEFPAQMASNAENVSIWWRHHVLCCVVVVLFVSYHIL